MLESLKVISADYAGQDVTQTTDAVFGKICNEDLTKFAESNGDNAMLTMIH